MINSSSFSRELSRKSEKGGVIVIFSVFMMTMIPILALSIDTYFMVQGRLEEQNLAEYAALTSLDGYVAAAQELTDHAVVKEQALTYLESIEGDNSVTGLIEGSGWSFTEHTCSGNLCTGGNWNLQFGDWDKALGIFTPAVPQTADPESINPAWVDAIKITMVIPDGGFIDYFRKSVSGSPSNIKLPASAIAYMERDGSANKYFRLARIRASGQE